jgi:hypothetical protein
MHHLALWQLEGVRNVTRNLQQQQQQQRQQQRQQQQVDLRACRNTRGAPQSGDMQMHTPSCML